MIADLKPYAEYKESGLAVARKGAELMECRAQWQSVWTAKPNWTWRTSNSGSLAKYRCSGPKFPSLDTQAGHVRHREVQAGSGKGDVAYNMMRMWQGARGGFRLQLMAWSARTMRYSRSIPVTEQNFSSAAEDADLVEQISALSHRELGGILIDCIADRFGTIQSHLSPARRAGGDCPVSGMGEQAAGAGDPGEAKGDRAAERTEAGHHPPHRHPGPRPHRPP